MTDAIIRRGRHRHIEREDNLVKVEGERRAMLLQAKGCQGLLAARCRKIDHFFLPSSCSCPIWKQLSSRVLLRCDLYQPFLACFYSCWPHLSHYQLSFKLLWWFLILYLCFHSITWFILCTVACGIFKNLKLISSFPCLIKMLHRVPIVKGQNPISLPTQEAHYLWASLSSHFHCHFMPYLLIPHIQVTSASFHTKIPISSAGNVLSSRSLLACFLLPCILA